MIRTVPLRIIMPLLATAAALASADAHAAPGGPLHTLPLGRYVCELPGDALGPVGDHQPQADFAVIFGSSYQAASGKGIYLLTGDRMVFTSGPFKGIAYHRITGGFLRRIEADGSDGRLRCVRQGGSGS